MVDRNNTQTSPDHPRHPSNNKRHIYPEHDGFFFLFVDGVVGAVNPCVCAQVPQSHIRVSEGNDTWIRSELQTLTTRHIKCLMMCLKNTSQIYLKFPNKYLYNESCGRERRRIVWQNTQQYTITTTKIISSEASGSTASYCLNKQSTDPLHASVLEAGGHELTQNMGKQHV